MYEMLLHEEKIWRKQREKERGRFEVKKREEMKREIEMCHRKKT
jgi:hypothetical protein